MRYQGINRTGSENVGYIMSDDVTEIRDRHNISMQNAN